MHDFAGKSVGSRRNGLIALAYKIAEKTNRVHTHILSMDVCNWHFGRCWNGGRSPMNVVRDKRMEERYTIDCTQIRIILPQPSVQSCL